MATNVELSPGPKMNEFMEAEHIENVGSVSSEDNDSPIYSVVLCVMDEEEHENEADEFDDDAADGDVSVLLD